MLQLAVVQGTREGDFAGLGRVALVQALLQPPLLLLLAGARIDGALCLALADAAGHGAAALYLGLRQRRSLWEALGSRWSLRGLALTARVWQGLPLLNLPGSLLSLGFVTAPLLIVPAVADPTLAGHVALALRLFDVPTQIIGAATTPILLNRLRPRAGRGGSVFGRRFLAGLVGLVTLLYAGAAVALLLLAPFLDGTVFADLGDVAAAVAAFQAFVAVAGPLTEGCGLYREQGALNAIHGLAIAGAAAALVTALALGPLAALWVLAFAAAARAFALGERLRVLSIRSRDGQDAAWTR